MKTKSQAGLEWYYKKKKFWVLDKWYKKVTYIIGWIVSGYLVLSFVIGFVYGLMGWV